MEARRGRRIIKTKQWKSRRHRRCIERRRLFANSISNLYTKRLPQNSYQESVRYTSVALLCRRHLLNIAFTSVPSVTLCAYYIRLLVYHSIFRKNRKNKMYHNSKNTSKLLLPRTSPPQNTLFLTFIPISLIIYNKRNIQNESSCHSCHKRIAYNLLICSIFA